MSQSALDALARVQSELNTALGGHDPRAINAACDQFRTALFEVRAVGAWRAHPELAQSAASILARVELAQQHVKNLTREMRERMAVLETSRETLGVRLYGRKGASAT